MKTRSIYLFGPAVVLLILIVYIAQRQRSAPEAQGNTGVGSKSRPAEHGDVVLRVSPTQSDGADAPRSTNIVRFEILNAGHSALMCPDGWSLEFDDGTVQQLSLPMSGNLRVQAGGKGEIAITKPVTARSWRLMASYYFEDVVFDVKVKIDQSVLKNHLPSSFSSVQGRVVVSDWLK